MALPREPWKTREAQNVFDLALNVYGDVSNIDKFIAQMGSMADVTTGTLFDTEFTDNFLANTLFSKKIVATSQNELALTVDSDIITVDDTTITVDETMTI